MASEELELVKAKEALSLARDKRLTLMRQCNTCRIANVCVAFKEDADCSLTQDVPTIKNDDDADSLLGEVIRIQTERVLHATLIEKQEGTLHVDTDKQIELLTTLLKTRQSQRNKANTIKIEGSGEGVSVLGSLVASLGRPTSSGTTQRPEARHHSKASDKQSMKNLDEVEDADFRPVIDVKK